MTNPSNRLWLQPGEVWSLWDMIEHGLGDLIEASNCLTRIGQALAAATDLGANPRNFLAVNILGDLRKAAATIEKIAREVDLDATESAARRLVELLDGFRARHERDGGRFWLPDSELDELREHLQQITVAYADQAQSRFALVLTRGERELFEGKQPHFGETVFERFNDAGRDIDEAAKCLALHRNTACVFHLMLAMERALRKLGDKIGIELLDKKGKPDRWASIVGKIKAEIPSRPADAQEDWTQAHNLLWGVGRVWRNDTMHPAEAYTDDEARDVFDSVRVFMRHLATMV